MPSPGMVMTVYLGMSAPENALKLDQPQRRSGRGELHRSFASPPTQANCGLAGDPRSLRMTNCANSSHLTLRPLRSNGYLLRHQILDSTSYYQRLGHGAEGWERELLSAP